MKSMRVIVRLVAGIILLIGRLLMLGGLGILVYQGYHWFRYGTWNSLSLNDALWSLNWILPYSLYDWLAKPTDWAGINKIILYLLAHIPAFACLIITGMIIAWIVKPLRY